MHPRPIVATLLAAVVALSACSPAAPSTKPTAAPKAESADTGPTAVPTQAVAKPSTRLVEKGRIASPSPTVHTFLWGNPETTERDLTLAKDAGFTWVKQRFEWRYVEKTEADTFEWQEPDRVIDAINKNGLGIVARIDNQPEWARADGIFPASGPPDKNQDFTDFLKKFTQRYKGKVQAYEIWNEPNLSREWGNAAPSAQAYTELLRVSYETIKKNDPEAIVISAGLSPTSEQTDRARADVTFLREMYQAGAQQHFDMLGVHAPGFKAAPETDPAQIARDPALNNNDPSAEEARRVYGFRHVEDMRAVMQEFNDGNKQISLMEMGWTSDPRPDSPYRWHAVSEQEKGEYLARAFTYAAQNWSPWIGHMTVIYLPDPGWTPDMEQTHWGITNPDGTARPAYDALKATLGAIVSGATGGPAPGASPAVGASPVPSPSPSPSP